MDSANRSRTVEQANFHHLIWNATWFGAATPAVSRFLSVFAIHVGATPLMLGMLAAMPGIGALLTAALANRWMRRYTSPVKAVFWPALGLRLNYLLLVFTPFLPAQWQPFWIMLVALFPAMAEGVSSVAFLVMMRQAIAEKLITPLVSRRQFGMNLALGISTVVFGFWLERAAFPASYQIMFGVCFLFALISLWHTMQVQVTEPALSDAPAESNKVSVWHSPGFQRVAVATVATHIAFLSIAPVITLWLINRFGAGEQFIALFGLAELVAAVIIAAFTNRLIQYLGNRTVMSLAMVVTAAAAVILALAPSMYVTLIAAALSGAAWTCVNIALFGYFSESTPVADSPRYTTVYIQLIYLSIFVGPLLGSSLADHGVDLTLVLLLGALFRLLAGGLIQIDLPRKIRARTQRIAQAATK